MNHSFFTPRPRTKVIALEILADRGVAFGFAHDPVFWQKTMPGDRLDGARADRWMRLRR